MKVKIEITDDSGETLYNVNEFIAHATGDDPWTKTPTPAFKMMVDQIIDDERVHWLEIQPFIQGKSYIEDTTLLEGDKK